MHANSSSTGKRVLISVVAAGLALASIFLYGRHVRADATNHLKEAADGESSQPPQVDVVPVTRSVSDRILSLPGDARPFYETVLFARTSGYLKKWNVDIGDSVKEGQVLAEIQSPELDDQLKEAQAKATELGAEVKLAQTTADFAKISYDRWGSGAPDGVVSQQERDQKKSELDAALAHVEAAKANLALGQADVDRLQTLEGFKKVTAPFTGVVTERHVDIGDLVTAGSSSNTTSMFKIAQFDKVRIFVDVPQGNSGDMKHGLPVSAYAPEHPEQMFDGFIDRTASAIDPVSRTLRVEVLVDNKDLSLLPGTYLEVDFKTRRQAPPLRVPAAAVTMRSSGPQVAVVSDDGTVRFHKIKIEQDLGDYVEIASGLLDGEKVALNISRDVADGGKVRTHVDDASDIEPVPEPAPEPGPAPVKPAASPVADAGRPKM